MFSKGRSLDLKTILLRTAKSTLVITAHRHGPMLEQCLDAVAGLDPAPDRTFVVVDGCDRRVAESAQGRGFEVLVLENAPGVSAARNAGAFHATTRFVAFLDSDVVPYRDHMNKAIAALQTQPGAVAAFGSYDDSPDALGLISRYRNLLHHFTHQNARRDAESFWAACGICDAEIFRQVGGFDESYSVPSIEDIALGYKLRRAGHRIALDPSWQVKHLKQWTWRDLVFTDIGRRAIPWTLLLLHERRLDNDLNIDTRSRWSALLVLAFLGTLATGFVSPWLLSISAACLAGAIFLNRRFYQFLSCKGGLPFALGAIPLHLLYYLAATIGWFSGHAIWFFGRILQQK